jgi:hypothetical protein
VSFNPDRRPDHTGGPEARAAHGEFEDSEVKGIQVGWSGVQLHGLRIKGGPGWPVADTLRAERGVIFPSVRSVLTGTVRVGSITVVRPYLSAMRSQAGRLRVVPSLLETPAPKRTPPAGPPGPAIIISRTRVENGVLELFDATVAQPPLKIRLEKIEATIRNVAHRASAGRVSSISRLW